MKRRASEWCPVTISPTLLKSMFRWMAFTASTSRSFATICPTPGISLAYLIARRPEAAIASKIEIPFTPFCTCTIGMKQSYVPGRLELNAMTSSHLDGSVFRQFGGANCCPSFPALFCGLFILNAGKPPEDRRRNISIDDLGFVIEYIVAFMQNCCLSLSDG